MLTITRQDAVVEVEMNRPEVRNAFAPPMIEALTAWARGAAADATIRVVVMSGAGPVFCAGADLGWMRETRDYDRARNLADAERLAEMFDALDRLPMPLVARVHGAALGGGAGLLAVCDHVVATETTRIGFTEVRMGLLPAVIAPFVARRIGWSACRSLFLTGRRIDAVEAARLGLVHEAVAADALREATSQVVSDLLQGAPSAQRETKRLVAALSAGDRETRALTTEAIARQRVSPDGQEGLTAFLEKRAAAWVPAE